MGGNGFSPAGSLVVNDPDGAMRFQVPVPAQRHVAVTTLRVHQDGHMEAVLADGSVLIVQGIAMSARAGQHTSVTLTVDRVRVEVAGSVETGRRGTDAATAP